MRKKPFPAPSLPVVTTVVVASILVAFYTTWRAATEFKKQAKTCLPKQQEASTKPLTDIAPPPPVVSVETNEGPQERLQRLNLPPPPQAEVKLPVGEMDVHNPPQWTKTIARPAAHPVPPDPLIPPPVKVDPSRRAEPEIERLSTGTYEQPK